MIFALLPITILSMAAALAYPWFAETEPKKKVIIKGIASLLFVFGGLVMTIIDYSTINLLIMLALVFGAIGDFFLALQGTNKDRRVLYTIIGGFAFFAGHIAYIVFFLLLRPLNRWLLFIPAVSLIVPLIFYTPIRMALGTRKFLPLPTCYFAVVGLMLASALNILIVDTSVFGALVFTAGVVFAISDTILMARFAMKSKKARTIASYFIALLYFSAQWLFIWAVAVTYFGY